MESRHLANLLKSGIQSVALEAREVKKVEAWKKGGTEDGRITY